MLTGTTVFEIFRDLIGITTPWGHPWHILSNTSAKLSHRQFCQGPQRPQRAEVMALNGIMLYVQQPQRRRLAHEQHGNCLRTGPLIQSEKQEKLLHIQGAA